MQYNSTDYSNQGFRVIATNIPQSKKQVEKQKQSKTKQIPKPTKPTNQPNKKLSQVDLLASLETFLQISQKSLVSTDSSPSHYRSPTRSQALFSAPIQKQTGRNQLGLLNLVFILAVQTIISDVKYSFLVIHIRLPLTPRVPQK